VDEEVADSTAINCWMEDPPDKDVQRCGHVIRFNYISDVYGCEVIDGKVGRSRMFPSSGIYLDNYTSNCFVYGNIIVRCAHSGIVVHAGKNNLIENNIIIDSPRSITFQDYVSGMEYWKQMNGFMTGNHVLRNIFYHSIPNGKLFGLHAWTDRVIAQSDYNIFFHVGNSEYAIDDYTNATNPINTLEKWQRLGYDANSMTADPLFVDPKKDDYRLKPESPAFELGFNIIDMSKIGISNKGL
jgi:parallel beta-helix repeat protein